MIDFTSFDEKIIVAPFCLKPLFLSKKRLNPRLNFKILSLEDLEKICFGSLKKDMKIISFMKHRRQLYEARLHLSKSLAILPF